MTSVSKRVSTPFRHFLRGFHAPVRAGRLLLDEKRVKRYALYPVLVNIVLFFAVLAAMILWVVPSVDAASWVPEWMGETVRSVVSGFKWLVFFVLFCAGAYFTFTTAGFIVASPFNDVLSERVEEILRGEAAAHPMNAAATARATAYSLRVTAVTALIQLLLTLVCLPLLLVPIIGAIPLFLVNAYYGGLGLLDVPMARHFLRASHRKAGMRGRRWEIFGLGCAMFLLLLIPFMGMFLMPLGVVGATILYCEIDWRERLEAEGLDAPENYSPPSGADAEQPD